MDIDDITPYEDPGSLLRKRTAQPSLHGQTEVEDANRTKKVNPYDNVRDSQVEQGEERRYLNVGEMREHERMSSCKYSAGNNFSSFTGHMSFQIFLLVGHFTNWTGHNLTDNTLKKITQDVLVRCSVIVSDFNAKLAGHFQNLVEQGPLTNCYFHHCK